jgi:hypothetical protein
MIPEVTSFPEGLAIWAWTTLEMAAWLIACGLIFALQLGVLAGIALAISRLGGRIHRARVPRNGGRG